MEELKQIIDNKCAEFKGLKIYTGWFYDFAEMLLQQGYTQKQISNILEQIMSNDCMENMSGKGMMKYFGNVQSSIDNEKAFFDYTKSKLDTQHLEYLKKGLQYAVQEAKNVGNFIDAFIKYVVITNFEDLQLQYKDQTSEHWEQMLVSCCLGDFALSTMLCEAESDKIYFDELHTRKNLTGTKIGAVLFKGLFKKIHHEFPDRDLYTLRLKKDNEGAKRFYERMGGTVYDYGNESQFGVVYKKENLKELSEKDVAPPTLYPSRKEEFLNSLKVDITNKEQDPFPSDEDISKKMDISDKFYSFDMDDIDKKIKIPKLTKNGEQLYLYRRSIRNRQLGSSNSRIDSQYFILNNSGQIVGRVPVSVLEPYSLSMDYWIKDEFQGQGIGTVVLEEIIRQIYDGKEFDGIDCISAKFPDANKTSIQNIKLEISDENEASIKIAMKNGFKKAGERYYSLTLNDFIERNQERVE